MAKRIGRPPKIVEELMEKIKVDWVRGKEAGERLPKEADLADQYGASRGTIRSALSLLENNRFVYRLASRGVYVSPKTAGLRKIYSSKLISLAYFRDHYSFPFMGSFWQSVLQGLHTSSYSVGINFRIAVQNTEFLKETGETIEKHLVCPSTVGIMLIGPQPNDVKEQLRDIHTPIVSMDCDATDISLDSFCFENHAAGATLARRLHKLGHRTIVMVREDPTKISRDPAWQERNEGFLQEAASLGLPAPHEIIIKSRGKVIEEITPSIRNLFAGSNDPKPSAIFFPGMFHLERWRPLEPICGFEIPKTMTIVGCGDLQNTSTMTGIRFDPREIGSNALYHLMGFIRSGRARPSHPTVTRFKGHYVAGESHGHGPFKKGD